MAHHMSKAGKNTPSALCFASIFLLGRTFRNGAGLSPVSRWAVVRPDDGNRASEWGRTGI